MKVGSLLKGWFAVGVLGFVFFVFWLVGRLTSREMVSDVNAGMWVWSVWFGWLFVCLERSSEPNGSRARMILDVDGFLMLLFLIVVAFPVLLLLVSLFPKL